MKTESSLGAQQRFLSLKNKNNHGSPLSRRKFFGRASGISLSAAAVALMSNLHPSPSRAHQAVESDIEIINGALAAENELEAAYENCIKTELLGPTLKEIFTIFKSHHAQHSDKLGKISSELGAVATAQQSDYIFPVKDLLSEQDLLAFVADLEQSITIAYVDAVGTFADHSIRKLVASILAAEAMHWAVLDSNLGKTLGSNAFVL